MKILALLRNTTFGSEHVVMGFAHNIFHYFEPEQILALRSNAAFSK
jgi:hypothetical protein